MNQTHFTNQFSPVLLELYSQDYLKNYSKFLDEVFYEKYKPTLFKLTNNIITRINFATTTEITLVTIIFMISLWIGYIYIVTIPRMQELATPPALKVVKEQETNTPINTPINTSDIEHNAQLLLHKFIQDIIESGGDYDHVKGWTVSKLTRKSGKSTGKADLYYFNRRNRKYRSIKAVIDTLNL